MYKLHQPRYLSLCVKRCRSCWGRFTGTASYGASTTGAKVEVAVHEDISLLMVQGTAQGLVATAFPMVINKQTLSSIAIALGSRVSPKIKAKISAS